MTAKGDGENVEARKKRWAKETRAFETDRDLVPGTATHHGDGPGGGPTGGVAWVDAARMALARRPGDRTEQDWEAIGRHEDPPSGVTGRPGWESRGHPRG